MLQWHAWRLGQHCFNVHALIRGLHQPSQQGCVRSSNVFRDADLGPTLPSAQLCRIQRGKEED